jgi:hypothetical protein
MMTRRLFSIFVCVSALASLAPAADDGGAKRTAFYPAVMRNLEPPDNVIVALPGPPPEPVAKPRAVPAAAVTPAKALEQPLPYLRRAKREYPQGFEENSPKFLQERIGQWKESEVQDLLGQPVRRRPAIDDDGKENGVIYAFADPTGRYKEFELDFAAGDGDLRTVFVYPVQLTWQACRQLYGASVTAADAAKGRKFYSYLNRRMDVLVDAGGRVISLGLY